MMCIWLYKPRQQTHVNSADDSQWSAPLIGISLFPPIQKLRSLPYVCDTEGRAVIPTDNPGGTGTKKEYSLIRRRLENHKTSHSNSRCSICYVFWL